MKITSDKAAYFIPYAIHFETLEESEFLIVLLKQYRELVCYEKDRDKIDFILRNIPR